MHSVSRVSYVLDEFTDPASTPQHLNNEAYRSSSMHPLRVVETNRAFELSPSKSSVTLSSLISPMVKITPESAAIYAALTHTDSLPFISAQSTALDLLPDVSKQNISNPLLEYWNTGLYYKDEEVTFRIESLQGSKPFKSDTEEEGLIVIASANDCGKKIFGQLIDLVVSLVDEWYRDAFKLGSSGLQQKVPCFECITQGRAKPFQFEIEECLSMISKNETTLKCGYFCDEPAKNHIASLDDIVPDILLQYIDPQFLLNAEGIEYQDDSGSLLGDLSLAE